MKVLIFGATGMVGKGVLLEALRSREVERVFVVGRSSTGLDDPKLEEFVLPDVGDLSSQATRLADVDACLFCLGVSSAGMSMDRYTELTFDLTIRIARQLFEINPAMTFIYVSGAGTDSTESGRIGWARVKGKTENELIRIFDSAYAFRPGVIIPLDGIQSKTKWTNVMVNLTRPLHGFIRRLAPRHVTTTAELGRAMLEVARHGHPKQILEQGDIIETGKRAV